MLQQWLLGGALLAALAWNLAHAAELRGVELSTGATGTRAELQLDQKSGFSLIPLANPDRLVVDLPDVSLRRSLQLPPATGLVRGVRSGHPVPGTTRIVFDLAAPVVTLKPHFEQGADGARLVLEWPDDGSAGPAAVPVATIVASVPRSVPESVPQQSGSPAAAPDIGAVSAAATSRLIANLPASSGNPTTGPAVAPARIQVLPPRAQDIASPPVTHIATGIPTPTAPVPSRPAPGMARGPLRPLVIAIDPGHGGQDTGSVSASGTREKDLTLQIARELARQVNATPGLKAYLTRDSDFFIPLPQRARRAQAAKADIFLSIHADAWTSASARGAGVFILSLRGVSSQRARWLADKENAADVIGGDHARNADSTLTSVLLDLTQSGNLRASEDAAARVMSGLDRIGDMHKNEIERANFAVLRTSDRFPAMLVETGFISNPGEESKLRDPAYQRQLAQAILGGIDAYFASQPPPGTMYAARAEANAGNRYGGGSP